MDGRIKPDLAFFYDSVRAANGSGNTAYTEFSGTSSATPQTAGYFGLLFQMWHEGVWAGHGKKADVFTSRPQMATAKALMINGASRYDWLSGGANADLDRYKQGWGTADVKSLHEQAPKTSIIDESDPLLPLGVRAYTVEIAAGAPHLNATLVYTDPMGTVGAAHARVNDLSLRLTSPSGTVYWGNNGLTSGNASTPWGVSNTVDTVENVFLRNPAPGTWRVEVLGDEIVQDARPETPETDADFGLVVSGGVLRAYTDPCIGATGVGTYKGYACESAENFVTADGLSCKDTERKCALTAAANPGSSILCLWNDRVIHRRDVTGGACNPLVCQVTPGTGEAKGYVCGSHQFIRTLGTSCQSAVDVCARNAELNPSSSFLCTWKGTEIYRKERVPNICQGTP